MRRLAIETTTQTGSIAIGDDESGPKLHELPSDRRSAATLIPAIDDALRGHRPTEIAVAIGPGSFTGLRIAVVTAKTLAYAWRIPVVPVGSLAAIAVAAMIRRPDWTSCRVALNAYRRQAFVGVFDGSGGASDEECVAVDAVRRDDRPLVSDLESLSPDAAVPPSAEGVWHLAARGEPVDPFALAVRYFKPSAAEEKAGLSTPPKAS